MLHSCALGNLSVPTSDVMILILSWLCSVALLLERKGGRQIHVCVCLGEMLYGNSFHPYILMYSLPVSLWLFSSIDEIDLISQCASNSYSYM